MGVNTAIFSLVDVFTTSSRADLLDLKAQNTVFTDMMVTIR